MSVNRINAATSVINSECLLFDISSKLNRK